MLMEMMGAEQPKPKLKIVGNGKAPEIALEREESVKNQRLRPLERRRLAAGS
jgi:hypothetical protein